MGAGSISQQRIFIDDLQINSWPPPPSFSGCEELSIDLGAVDFNFRNNNYIPIDENVVNLVLLEFGQQNPSVLIAGWKEAPLQNPLFGPDYN